MTNVYLKIDFKTKTLKIPKIPPIKFRDNRIFKESIRNITISRNKIGHYFASILIEKDLEIIPIDTFNENNTLGIDMGLARIVTTGQDIVVPRYFRSLEDKLAKQQKSFSNKKKGSKNKNKQRLKVAAIHNKITNCRKDFLHKLSSSIIKNYDGVCVEDLNLKGMLKNRSLSKSVSDLGWAKFSAMLEYKALWAGKTLLKAGRFFPSSKLCNSCGLKNSNLKLSNKIWTCSCGACHDRDENAAINLKNYFLNTLGTREIKACGKSVRHSPDGPVLDLLKQEAPYFSAG